MYCFFKSVLKRQFKLNDIKEKPTKDRDIYVNNFDKNKAELFDELRDLIDGSFHNIPSICSKIKDTFPGIFTIKNLVALIKQRTDADKKDIDDMVAYCEKKFVISKAKVKTQDRILQKVEYNSSTTESKQEEEEEFDIEAFQRAGGIGTFEEDKATDLKAHINKTMAGYLDYRGNKRYFSIMGEKIFCYKKKKETLADNDTFPTLMLREVRSVVAKSNGFILKFTDTNKQPLEFTMLNDEDPEKWVDCIKNNLDDLKESSPKRVIQARPSVIGKFELSTFTDTFEVENPSIRTQNANIDAIEEEPRRSTSTRISPKKTPKSVVIYREPGFFEKYFFCFPCCLPEQNL
jgi:hypothetical protein